MIISFIKFSNFKNISSTIHSFRSCNKNLGSYGVRTPKIWFWWKSRSILLTISNKYYKWSLFPMANHQGLINSMLHFAIWSLIKWTPSLGWEILRIVRFSISVALGNKFFKEIRPLLTKSITIPRPPISMQRLDKKQITYTINTEQNTKNSMRVWSTAEGSE